MDSSASQDVGADKVISSPSTPSLSLTSPSLPDVVAIKPSTDDTVNDNTEQKNEDDVRKTTINELQRRTFDSIVTLIKVDHPQPNPESQGRMEMKLDVLTQKYNENHILSRSQEANLKALSSLVYQMRQKNGCVDSEGFSKKRTHDPGDETDGGPPRKIPRSNDFDISGLTDFSFLGDNDDERVRGVRKEEMLTKRDHRTNFRTIVRQLASLIQSNVVSQDMAALMLSLVKEMSTRYNKVAKTGCYRLIVTRKPHPKTPAELLHLLRPNREDSDQATQREEDVHPWRVVKSSVKIPIGEKPSASHPGLLLRAWDHKSECQIHDPLIGFLSGGTNILLDTPKERKDALEQHTDWSNKKKTPFISATTSIEEIFTIWAPVFERRQKRNGLENNEKVTIINACARLANGWPILRAKDELQHYKACTPFKYGGAGGWNDPNYLNEYLLPYRIGPAETVTTWLRRDIVKWCKEHKTNEKGWYDTIAVKVFEDHEKARKEGRDYNSGRHCTCCGGFHGFMPTPSANQEDSIADAEKDAIADAEKDAIADAEKDAIVDGEQDSVEDTLTT